MKRTQKDFLNAVKKVDRRYFAEVADRIAAPERFAQTQKGNGRVMKQKRHFSRKYVWGGIGIAAALLCAGGITAAVAWRGQDTTTQPDDISDRVIEISDTIQPIEVYEPLNPFNPKLTDQADIPTEDNMVETEHGYYYKSYSWDKGIETSVRGLRYSDKETGESVYLCARANCQHDGNEYCVATTSAYRVLDLAWLDQALYAVALKNDKNMNYVLLRYEPDGSAVSEVAVLPREMPENIVFPDGMIEGGTAELTAHRGVLWISVEYSLFGYKQDDLYPNEIDSDLHAGAWAFYAYEPSSKNFTVLMQTPEWSKEYATAPHRLAGYGDYIYFHKGMGDVNPVDPLKVGMYRLNCRNGQFELLCSDNLWSYPKFASGSLTDGSRLVYLVARIYKEETETTVKEETETITMELTDYELHLYDLRTQTDAVLAHNVVDFTADAECIYAMAAADPYNLNSQSSMQLLVYDWKGNSVSESTLTLTLEKQLYPDDSWYSYDGISCGGDTLYLQTGIAVYALPVRDARAGNTELTHVYQHEFRTDSTEDG